jgi:hypothetical protein
VAMALDLAKGVATMVMGEMTPKGIVSTVESAAVEGAGAAGPAAAAGGTGQPAYHPPFSLGGTRFLNT